MEKWRLLHKYIRHIAGLVCVYLASWFVVYAVIMEFDFRLIFSYFKWSWSGGFELPSFIQFFAIATTVLYFIIIAILFFRKRKEMQ